MVYVLSIKVYCCRGFSRNYAKRPGFGGRSHIAGWGGEGLRFWGIGWLPWRLDRLCCVGGLVYRMTRYPDDDRRLNSGKVLEDNMNVLYGRVGRVRIILDWREERESVGDK